MIVDKLIILLTVLGFYISLVALVFQGYFLFGGFALLTTALSLIYERRMIKNG